MSETLLDIRHLNVDFKTPRGRVHALRDLTREPVPEQVLEAYGLSSLAFGPDYILPKPLDSRLIERIPPAVARAAVDSGSARRDYPEHYPLL